jgi:UPF0755 protein
MRKALIAASLVVLLVGAAAIVAGTVIWGRLHQPYRGFEAAEVFVDIPAGASQREIGRRLIEAGVVRDELDYRTAVWWRGDARRLRAGEYRFADAASPLDVVDRIARGDVFAHLITFREGLTLHEKAEVFERRGFGSAEAFVEAAQHAALITDLDPAATDLEGYLFPETYALPRTTPASRLVAMMVDRFRAVYTEDLRERARAQGLSTREVVTLASIVEKEAGLGEERPLVAAVFRNRLRIGMGMQADPTVIYALQRAGRWDGNITRADLQFDSPYNTYRYRGLPPGPIAAPGRASLEATLAPADVPYLYFVSRNDGSHVFSRTYAEHRRNVQEYQVLYFQRLREQQAREARDAVQ